MSIGERNVWYIEGGMKNGRRSHIRIHTSTFLIRRGQGCNLTVNAPGASRKHMQTDVDGNRVYVTDSQAKMELLSTAKEF